MPHALIYFFNLFIKISNISECHNQTVHTYCIKVPFYRSRYLARKGNNTHFCRNLTALRHHCPRPSYNGWDKVIILPRLQHYPQDFIWTPSLPLMKMLLRISSRSDSFLTSPRGKITMIMVLLRISHSSKRNKLQVLCRIQTSPNYLLAHTTLN